MNKDRVSISVGAEGRFTTNLVQTPPSSLVQRSSSFWAIWLTAIVVWNLVPYKSWTREIFGSEGFNLGDAVLLAVLTPYVVATVKSTKDSPINQWITLIWAITTLSLIKGLASGEDMRDMFRIVRAVLCWGIVPLMQSSLRDPSSERKWFSGMTFLLVTASLSIILFSYYPGCIPLNDEVASSREATYGDVERVFTNGMWAVFAGSIFALAATISPFENRRVEIFVLVLLLLGMLHTFVRTFVFLLVFAFLLLTFRNWRAILRSVMLPAAIGLLFILLFGLPPSVQRILDATVLRISGVITADFTDIDPTDEQGFGSLIWRLTEFEAVVSNMPDLSDQLIGKMGHKYDLDAAYSASVPHISYLGIYYAHGFVGLAVYLMMIVVVSKRLWRNARIVEERSAKWISQGAFVCWVCLLLGAFTAPLFQFPYGTATMAFVIGISESVRYSHNLSGEAIRTSQQSQS